MEVFITLNYWRSVDYDGSAVGRLSSAALSSATAGGLRRFGKGGRGGLNFIAPNR